MRNIIWRNRASAILGLMIILLAFIDGFPDGIKTFFFIVLGALIALFGFTSNRYAAEIGDEGGPRKNIPERDNSIPTISATTAEASVSADDTAASEDKDYSQS